MVDPEHARADQQVAHRPAADTRDHREEGKGDERLPVGRGDQRKLSPGADAYVRRFVRKNKAKRVPLAQAGAKEIMAEFFGSAPRTHVACLMDAVRLVEAGSAGTRARSSAVKARSDAWAARRVPDALAADVDDGRRSCWPNGGRFDKCGKRA